MAVGDCNQVEEENQKMEGWGCWVIVPPFECKWLLEEDLTFREAGKGCVVFEAFADNDVTVVFREEAGSKHCHYRRDYRPDYAVVLGSHRNRRLRIEAGGESVADVVGPKLCSSDGFQSFWISICDGMISVGKGTEPGVGVVLQWRDSQPRCKVRYVGLSSWDKHVGYRNVRVLSLPPACKPRNLADTEELRGLEGFLERWELADVRILVGSEGRVVPAHRIVLALCCNDVAVEDETIRLPSVDYQILHALLQFMYTGRTQVSVPQLEPLCELSEEFGVESLVLQCEQMKEALKDKFAGEDQKVELLHSNPVTFSRNHPSLSSDLPVDVQRLKSLLETGDYSDVKIYIEGHGLVAEAHKLVLSAWSTPFAKMFTNGMSESTGSEIHLRDILPEAFLLMLQFMYSGELGMDETQDLGPLLLPLLLLADQFGISMLQQECCEYLLECLSEDSVCPILQVISFTPACRSLEEACETYFAQHFDYCTTSSRGFTMLEKASFMRILQHPHLVVTSEERVLDAVLTWASMGAYNAHSWDGGNADSDYKENVVALFGQRLEALHELLPLVRFPLMSLSLLQKLSKSNLCLQVPVLQQLIMEALQYLEADSSNVSSMQKKSNKSWLGGCVRFHHRPSSYKHLLYICDGDHNGVLYYAGTSYGQHQWMNPVLTKMISVTASSPSSRYTDGKALVSRDYQPTSFAGPCIENGKKTAWWKVDLGEGHQLMCNYYTMRQDGSMCYPRSWSLQGSLDGEHWTDLCVHNDDRTICKPRQFASFPIHGAKAYLRFRFFRVALNAPTTCQINPWNLCISYIEFYGYFK